MIACNNTNNNNMIKLLIIVVAHAIARSHLGNAIVACRRASTSPLAREELNGAGDPRSRAQGAVQGSGQRATSMRRSRSGVAWCGAVVPWCSGAVVRYLYIYI